MSMSNSNDMDILKQCYDEKYSEQYSEIFNLIEYCTNYYIPINFLKKTLKKHYPTQTKVHMPFYLGGLRYIFKLPTEKTPIQQKIVVILEHIRTPLNNKQLETFSTSLYKAEDCEFDFQNNTFVTIHETQQPASQSPKYCAEEEDNGLFVSVSPVIHEIRNDNNRGNLSPTAAKPTEDAFGALTNELPDQKWKQSITYPYQAHEYFNIMVDYEKKQQLKIGKHREMFNALKQTFQHFDSDDDMKRNLLSFMKEHPHYEQNCRHFFFCNKDFYNFGGRTNERQFSCLKDLMTHAGFYKTVKSRINNKQAAV